jgi:hypothetical protein
MEVGNSYSVYIGKLYVFYLIRTYANWTNIGHLDAKSGNFRSLNPLNPPYQGDFKKECVSPIGE